MKFKAHIARHGIPQYLMSDDAQFISAEFLNFANAWGIELGTSTPGYSRSNGKVESAVKAAKNMMKKCASDGTDQYLALLELRNTPMQGLNLSPSQIMFQRRTHTILPTTSSLLKPQVVTPEHKLHKKV